VLKGSARSLRVMAPPPLLYANHTLGVFRHHLWCLSTPPQCGIPTFTGGTCSRDVKIKIGVWEFWWPPNSNSFHQKRFNTSTINQVFVFYQLIPNTFISQRIAIPRLGTPPKLYSPSKTPIYENHQY